MGCGSCHSAVDATDVPHKKTNRYPHGLNARQFAYMVQWGMTPMQAIQSATVRAAELLGWSEKAGSLAPGRFADIVAVDGDPLQDVKVLEKMAFVMKDGAVVVSR